MKHYTNLTQAELEALCVSDDMIADMLSTLDRKNYVIERDLDTLDDLKREFKELYGFLCIGFTREELRTYPVKFKFTTTGKEYELQLRRFVSNLILWYGVIELGGHIEPRHINPFTITTGDTIANYINKYYIADFRDIVNYKDINKTIADRIYALSKISLDFNNILGCAVTLETYRGTAKRFPRFKEILNYKLDPNLLPHEVEDIVGKLTKEQVSLIKQDPDSIIRVFIEAKVGARESALQEFIVAGSNKPDLLGNTMPVPIDTNYIMGGLSNMLNYYIDAVAGRKSIILNKTEMGKSGYFAILVILLNSNTRMADVEDCGSVRTISMSVKDKRYLDKLVGRYYIGPNGKLEMIKETDEHLIGKIINVRSPITCACKKGICKTCYGALSDLNNDISIGGLSAILIMLKVQQDILSSKHILTTSSVPINFNEEFYKFFQIYTNEIVLNTNSTEDDLDVNKLSLIIDFDDRVKDTEEDVFDKDLTSTYISKMHLGTVKKKRGKDEIEINKMYTFEEVHGTNLTLSEAIATSKKLKNVDDVYYINLEDIPDETAIFTLEIENNELTKPLYDIKHILDNKSHNNNNTMDEIANSFLDCILQAKIPVQSLNAEMLIYPLIRRKDNKYKRPNFKHHVFDEEITILTVKSALKNNPSIALKLSSESLEEQLRDLNTYKMVEPSYIDDLFRDRLFPIVEKGIQEADLENLLDEDDEEDDDYGYEY